MELLKNKVRNDLIIDAVEGGSNYWYYFGDEAQKSTCLWLKNLPKLRYGKDVQMAFGESHPPQSDIVGKGEMHITKSGKKLPKWYSLLGVNEDRQCLRSKTFNGIAQAMASQWSSL